jgi:hypothetical protein
MTYSVVLSLLFALIGVVMWIEGGPHPRTWGAWLLLVAIVVVAALPMLLCWLFCYTAAAPIPVGIPDPGR